MHGGLFSNFWPRISTEAALHIEETRIHFHLAALTGRSTGFVSGHKKSVCLLLRPSALSSLLCHRCAKLIWSGRSMSSLRQIGPSAASHFMASRSSTRRKRARIERSSACVGFHFVVTPIF